MSAIEKLIESLFCAQFKQDLVQHFSTCEHCQKGLVQFIDQMPVLSMMLPAEIKNKIKELKHGNGSKGR